MMSCAASLELGSGITGVRRCPPPASPQAPGRGTDEASTADSGLAVKESFSLPISVEQLRMNEQPVSDLNAAFIKQLYQKTALLDLSLSFCSLFPLLKRGPLLTHSPNQDLLVSRHRLGFVLTCHPGNSLPSSSLCQRIGSRLLF